MFLGGLFSPRTTSRCVLDPEGRRSVDHCQEGSHAHPVVEVAREPTVHNHLFKLNEMFPPVYVVPGTAHLVRMVKKN